MMIGRYQKFNQLAIDEEECTRSNLQLWSTTSNRTSCIALNFYYTLNSISAACMCVCMNCGAAANVRDALQKSFLCGPRSRREQVMCPFPLNSRSYKYKTHGATWETYFARRVVCSSVCASKCAKDYYKERRHPDLLCCERLWTLFFLLDVPVN
jgi:hypothetical protein